MNLVTMEVEIDHGTLKAKEPDLLPETGSGLLIILSPLPGAASVHSPVTLPLVRCAPGTIVDPTADELDESLWG